MSTDTGETSPREGYCQESINLQETNLTPRTTDFFLIEFKGKQRLKGDTLLSVFNACFLENLTRSYSKERHENTKITLLELGPTSGRSGGHISPYIDLLTQQKQVTNL